MHLDALWLAILHSLFLSKVSILLVFYHKALNECPSQQDKVPRKEYYYPNALPFQ